MKGLSQALFVGCIGLGAAMNLQYESDGLPRQLPPVSYGKFAVNPPSKVDYDKIMTLADLHGPFMSLVKNCTPISALWIRAAYHDCAGGSVLDGVGGADGSLQYEINREENADLASTIGLFKSFVSPGVSLADVVALGGVGALNYCGGPAVEFYPGRRDAFYPNPAGRVPPLNPRIEDVTNCGKRLGLKADESLAFLSDRQNPGVSTDIYKASDDWGSGNIWQDIKSKGTVAPTGNKIYSDPSLRPWVDKFANDTSVFVTSYSSAFRKCIDLNQVPSLEPLTLILSKKDGSSGAYYRNEAGRIVGSRGYDLTTRFPLDYAGPQSGHGSPCDVGSLQLSRCSRKPGYIEICSPSSKTWQEAHDVMYEALPSNAGWTCRDTPNGHVLSPPKSLYLPPPTYDEIEIDGDGLDRRGATAAEIAQAIADANAEDKQPTGEAPGKKHRRGATAAEIAEAIADANAEDKQPTGEAPGKKHRRGATAAEIAQAIADANAEDKQPTGEAPGKKHRREATAAEIAQALADANAEDTQPTGEAPGKKHRRRRTVDEEDSLSEEEATGAGLDRRGATAAEIAQAIADANAEDKQPTGEAPGKKHRRGATAAQIAQAIADANAADKLPTGAAPGKKHRRGATAAQIAQAIADANAADKLPTGAAPGKKHRRGATAAQIAQAIADANAADKLPTGAAPGKKHRRGATAAQIAQAIADANAADKLPTGAAPGKKHRRGATAAEIAQAIADANAADKQPTGAAPGKKHRRRRTVDDEDSLWEEEATGSRLDRRGATAAEIAQAIADANAEDKQPTGEAPGKKHRRGATAAEIAEAIADANAEDKQPTGEAPGKKHRRGATAAEIAQAIADANAEDKQPTGEAPGKKHRRRSVDVDDGLTSQMKFRPKRSFDDEL
ncbi:hypothetical protein BDK51DRAFT_36482 [Blyttiomyces helicus]|uniref:Peroxidase n=1 Tax=Blyttiomyces helicus TaxID=388810 RepID=A0A4P9WMK1_9FUNG|nr:hypothetical protein BDK51DRAFT_36482 [Blyttiomyces helicus]|eukprot:RKO93712.1 hypothetical protein BDK51DRAFT_36482 [Blyttiomyces helicus]